jgi:hypothetical protein
MMANYGRVLFAVFSVLLTIVASPLSASDNKSAGYGTLLMVEFIDGPKDPSVVAGSGIIHEMTEKSDQKGLLRYADSLKIKYRTFTDKTDEYILLERIVNALMLPQVYNSTPLANKQAPLSLALYLLRQKDIPLDIASEQAIAVFFFYRGVS